jgi:hypothetical protein
MNTTKVLFKTPTDKEFALSEVARLDRAGCNQFEIARRLGVSQPTACHLLKKVRERYRESIPVEYAAKVGEVRALLRDVRREAWEAWERSKQDAHKEVRETAPGTARKLDKRGETLRQTIKRLRLIVTREERLPASEFLHVILKTISMECELYGINAEKAPVNLLVNVNNSQPAPAFDWTPLTEPAEVVDATALLRTQKNVCA